jgi:hypothetical protein
MKLIQHHLHTTLNRLLAAVFAVILVAGCQQSDSIEVYKDYKKPTPGTEPERSDAVYKALSAIPGVSEVTIQKNTGSERRGYYFYVDQYVDNSDPTKGTFKQLCLLEYEKPEAPVVLWTDGYALGDTIENIPYPDVATHLEANVLHVEHRYFGHSLPEPIEDVDFTYFYASQAAADLHRVVTLMKQHFFTKGNKWVSAGSSKSGITTTLYAYYSDLNGWDDIDLYMPFCAPFLVGTPEQPFDKSPDTYMIESCGAGYPKDSEEYKAFCSLKAYPSAIANNKRLRETCLKLYHLSNPDDYITLINAYPNDVEKACTVGVIHDFYDNLFDDFVHICFSDWAGMVPDPSALKEDSPQEDYDKVAAFIFSKSDNIEKLVSEKNDNTRAGYTPEQIIELRKKNADMPYSIQAYRELGLRDCYFGLVTGDYITPEYCEQVYQQHLNDQRPYDGLYHGQWDGGKLMKSVRQWVNTTRKNIFFVYGSNDPWSGGAIEVMEGHPTVTLLNVPGGRHTPDIFNEKAYNPDYATIITQALDKYAK